MNIKGKVVTLRAIEMEDLKLLSEWSNSPEIWHGLGGWHFPYSSLSTEQYIKSINNNSFQQQNFAIDTEEMGFIGTTNLVNIDWKNKNAFHGMMIGKPSLRGKGYALDALLAIMRYAFMELGLNRLDGDMVAFNERSIRFYLEKGGWKQEGVRRNWFYRGGKYHDKIIVGVTCDDYLAAVKNNNYWS